MSEMRRTLDLVLSLHHAVHTRAHRLERIARVALHGMADVADLALELRLGLDDNEGLIRLRVHRELLLHEINWLARILIAPHYAPTAEAWRFTSAVRSRQASLHGPVK